VCFFPGSILTIGAGATFSAALGLGYGVCVGTVAVWIGANIGALIAFLLGRHVLRAFVKTLVLKYRVLTAIDKAMDTKAFVTVLLLRFSPLIPFNAFNYLMGATSVGTYPYVLGSLLGMLPGTISFVFVGAAIASAARTASGGGNIEGSCTPDNTAQVVLLVVGIGMTVVVVVLISWYAKKELSKIVKTAETEVKEMKPEQIQSEA
jgi:uncharacterized membrane protein YdjX (TVP38/TMEM64 family)